MLRKRDTSGINEKPSSVFVFWSDKPYDLSRGSDKPINLLWVFSFISFFLKHEFLSKLKSLAVFCIPLVACPVFHQRQYGYCLETERVW